MATTKKSAACLAEPLASETEGCPIAKAAQNEPPYRNILFVCTGNTCRSPMAAALLRHAFRDTPNVTVSSAGLAANEGEPISEGAVLALEDAEIPSTNKNNYKAHRAQNLTEEMMARATAVIPLTASHAMQIFLRFPEYASRIKPMPTDISDPYMGSPEVYRHCLAELRVALSLLFAGEVKL